MIKKFTSFKLLDRILEIKSFASGGLTTVSTITESTELPVSMSKKNDDVSVSGKWHFFNSCTSLNIFYSLLVVKILNK